MSKKIEIDRGAVDSVGSKYSEFWGTLPLEDRELAEKITKLVAHAGGRKAAADAMGVGPTTLDNYRMGKTQPKFLELVKLARVARHDINYLLSSSELDGWTNKSIQQLHRTDEGVLNFGDLIDEETTEFDLQQLDPAEFVRLPRYDARASAGRGLVPVNEMPVGEVAFARDFLRNLGANPDYCYILEARGDSMWPTIPDGALLIADASKNDVDDGRIYHFNVMDLALVKRARFIGSKLFLTSDNHAAGYPPEEIGADRSDELRVGGRIMFTGHAPMPVR